MGSRPTLFSSFLLQSNDFFGFTYTSKIVRVTIFDVVVKISWVNESFCYFLVCIDWGKRYPDIASLSESGHGSAHLCRQLKVLVALPFF